MRRRVLIGVFEAEEDILAATRASREAGHKIVDVYAPYPVHGLDRAMALPPTRLPRICLLFGLLGAAAKVWFEYWATAWDWPINVGGRPWNSLPAFVPVTFEVMVLFAGVSTVLAFLFVSRLLPGKRPMMPAGGVTDNRFALVVAHHNAAVDVAEVLALFKRYGAVQVDEREEEGA